MAQNYSEAGLQIPLTAPAGGVTSGIAVLIGTLLVVPLITVAAGLPFSAATRGVWSLPKAVTMAFTEGQALYWDNAAKVVTSVVAGNTPVGFCVTLGGNQIADATASVLLSYA